MITLKIQLSFPSESDRIMGQFTKFHPVIDGLKTDAISVSSNVSGFSPLTAIARYYGLSSSHMEQLANESNIKKEVGVYPFNNSNSKIYLMVVPETGALNSYDAGNKLMNDLLAACAYCKVKSLYFYHYAMVLNELMSNEWRGILTSINQLSEKMDLQIVIALDQTQKENFLLILQNSHEEFPFLVFEM